MIQLNPVAKEHAKEFWRLYKSAFPKCERQPRWFVKRQQNRQLVELLAATDETGAFAGLAITVPYGGDLMLLNYLAVNQTVRGRGNGSQMLAALKARYSGRRVVLEIEKPDPAAENSVQRARRQAFYLKNGCESTGVEIHIYTSDMLLLCWNGTVSFDEYCRIQSNAFGPRLWKKMNVRLLSE